MSIGIFVVYLRLLKGVIKYALCTNVSYQVTFSGDDNITTDRKVLAGPGIAPYQDNGRDSNQRSGYKGLPGAVVVNSHFSPKPALLLPLILSIEPDTGDKQATTIGDWD